MATAHKPFECRIAMFDPATSQLLPPDHPVMRVATQVFYDECTPTERAAWHRFCCLNSRAPADVAVAAKISRRIEERGKELEAEKLS